jgi:mannose-6-phosphate isomerase-like protein (cupin superfamily)
MKGYVADIEDLTEEGTDFRKVLYTGQHLQLVLMALKPGEDIGMETHATHDQFFRIEKGRGEAEIDGVTHKIKGGDAVIVPAGARHNLTNTGDKPLRLYTIYGPPNHIDRLVQPMKSDALASTEVFGGVATEAVPVVRGTPPARPDHLPGQGSASATASG